ncbi:A/G-specific adenine glycosylase [Mucilaginibacter terrenus]|uniref:Adenine DNA glycosylase n=1 Tax=Mucilaginibacter terrenus TaxID=2482727 RepID=A0A3E2NK65_9SPHI|nr:A/G-specific adenine glycosylase [Mucilaginibacter terrenus]RFZ81389.1 A/G-specific adenine glycosylase [Mucilaginibacter terrenus]
MDLSSKLITWYTENKRDLPWRNTTDAYTIWLSEIILQQTRVEQGLPYFNRFLERYSTVTDFAAAPEDDILKLWQGLGYYSRGRNMLKTAQLVQEHYNGVFPVKYEQLLRLKGIGEYTAAAVSSFAANEAKAVVDGNVYRVLARYYGIDEPINLPKGKKLFQQLADEVLDQERPGLHNQAMMEFGAMLCKPRNPACGICPVRLSCVAFKLNSTTALPVKVNKIKKRVRFFNYLLNIADDKLVLNKRDESGIWANMYDLPLFESDRQLTPYEVLDIAEVQEYFGEKLKIKYNSPVVKHVLTHQGLFIQFIVIEEKPIKMKPEWFFTNVADLEKLALPKPIFIFIKYFFNF